ncbi:hypothetical protein DASC09_040350 [Saccharomycopsis crataegensis]|uniref:Major facilitator superfamily (MFS) profile domain-containing protein n=1 Tax=Saccharomycopsis crataegensis TaxID=43959 RepID=A0AAV5QR06_9ASCO|nr:hypothetical protein DASC09_040350 [Saccharomycopsis crataegensis]
MSDLYLKEQTSQSVSEEQINSAIAKTFPDDALGLDDGQETQYLSEESKNLRIEELAQSYGINNRKLVHKIDLFLIPPFCLLFFVSFLNKSYISFCFMDGFPQEFGIDYMKIGYSWAAFFVPYLVFQSFSNVVLKYIRPHFWIFLTVTVYGCISIGSAYTKHYPAFIACQFLHGLFQSATETSIYYILSHYYQREESQIRFSIIYSMCSLGGMVGTLINVGAELHLDGHNGLSSWRWVLIIEGAITLFSSLILFFTFPDFPEGARFFSDNETVFLIKKLEVFAGKSGYNLNFTARDVLSTIADPLIFLPAIMCFVVTFNAYFLNLLWPTSIYLLGYTGLEGGRRTCYVWICSFVWTLFTAFLSDRVKIRFPFFIFNCFITLACFGALFHHLDEMTHSVTKYTTGSLLIIANYAAIPTVICWSSMNLGGHLRKSIGISLEISMGSLGGMLSFWAFVSDDGNTERYKIGYAASTSLTTFACIICLIYVGYCYKQNQKKQTAEYRQKWNMLSDKQRVLKGDSNPEFTYMY